MIENYHQLKERSEDFTVNLLKELFDKYNFDYDKISLVTVSAINGSTSVLTVQVRVDKNLGSFDLYTEKNVMVLKGGLKIEVPKHLSDTLAAYAKIRVLSDNYDRIRNAIVDTFGGQ